MWAESRPGPGRLPGVSHTCGCVPGSGEFRFMVVIAGCIVVIACVLGGFSMAGGHMHSLVHPSEIVTIGGASLGALIVMSPKKVLIDLIKELMKTVTGSPYTRAAYIEMFQMMYDLLRFARKDGMMGLEKHLVDPHESPIISRYKIGKNHHVVGFLVDGMMPLVDGSATKDDLPDLFDAELHAMEEELHAPAAALAKTADALPGFGIVAAVLGIVVTMGHIDGPPSEIGHKVGAALVGTFLGILLSYGFFAPLAARMETIGHEEMAFFRTLSTIIIQSAGAGSPKVVIERARRGLPSECRPTREELDKLFADAPPV